MGKFNKYPKFSKIPPDFKLVKIEETFEYLSSGGDLIEVPEGFTSDGASIPQFAWSLVGGPYGEYTYAAFIHDFAYFAKLYPRRRCDKIFIEAMKDLGVSWLKRKVMYRAVRLVAWWGWRIHRKREE